MDIGTITQLGSLVFLALTFLLGIAFGTQYGGIFRWLRSRRKRNEKGASPSTTIANPPVVQKTPAAPPTQPAQESVPHNLAASRLLEERNQPRMARWALVLPLLCNRLGWLAFYGGLFAFMLNRFPLIGPWLGAISGPLSFASIFLMLLSILLPLIMVYISDIVLSLRALKP